MVLITFKWHFFQSYAPGCRVCNINGWRMIRGMFCCRPIGTSRPASVHKRMCCSLGVCVGWCQALPSSFIFLLSPKYSFKPSRFSSAGFFFYQVAHFEENSGSRNVKSACVWLVEDTQSFARDLCFVKVLSVSSWNYLGAKLIAPDPTSRCNRLSANLGFSQCSQVLSGRHCLTELSTALFFQGFDPWHCLFCSPLPSSIFCSQSFSSCSLLSFRDASFYMLFTVNQLWYSPPFYSHDCFNVFVLSSSCSILTSTQSHRDGHMFPERISFLSFVFLVCCCCASPGKMPQPLTICLAFFFPALLLCNSLWVIVFFFFFDHRIRFYTSC